MKAAGLYVGLGLGLSLGGGCIVQPDEDDDGSADTEAVTDTTPASDGTGVDPTTAPDSVDGSGSDGESGGSGGDVDATERCDAFCERWLAADCDEDWTMAGCMLTCESLTSAAACNGSANAYLDCVENTTIECDAAGATYALGCGLDWLEAIGCAVTEDANPEIVEPCADYCANIQEAACPGNGNEDDCNVGCRWSGNTGVGCDAEWGAFLSCANAAAWSCLLGFAVAEGCGEAFTAYGVCVGTSGA